MFRRHVLPTVVAAIQEYFKKNPRQDNEFNREKYERHVRNRSGGWSYAGHKNGDRECARRRRQIADGQLKTENGLTYDEPPFKTKASSNAM